MPASVPARAGDGDVVQVWRDRVTAEPRPPGTAGAVPVETWAASWAGKVYDVGPEHVDLAQPRYRLTAAGRQVVEALHAEASKLEAWEQKARKKRKPGRKAKVSATWDRAAPLARTSFRSASEAAKEFIAHNEEQVSGLAQGDMRDALRDWMDGFEVRRGRTFKRANQTAKGREILDAAKVISSTKPIRLALVWLFSQSKSKRYEDVPWGLVDGLAEALIPACKDEQERQGGFTEGEVCGGWSWYPLTSGALSEKAIRWQLGPAAQLQAAEAKNAAELGGHVSELVRAFAKVRACMDPNAAAVVRRRIGILRKMAKHPEIISGSVCGTDEARACGFEAVAAEVRRVQRACERAGRQEGAPVTIEEREREPHPAQLAEPAGDEDTASNPAASKRNPWGTLTDLEARVLELEVANKDGTVTVHTWTRDRPRLYWSPTRRALVFVDPPPAATSSKARPRAPPGKAAAAFARWHSRRPSATATLRVPAVRLAQLGPAVRIVYTSTRYRDGRPRHHDFGPAVRVRSGRSGRACVYAVAGGTLTATGRGLVG